MKDKRREIINHLSKYVGSVPTLIKTIKDEKTKMSFEVAIFRANNGRPYHILSTIGLSNYKMSGHAKYNEIIIYLDETWNLFSDSEEYGWIYNTIMNIANAFLVSKRIFEAGQVFLTRGSNTFSKWTELNSAILYYPIGLDNDSWSLKLDWFHKINFRLLTMATYREYSIIRRMGGLDFVQDYLLDDGDVDNLVIFNKREERSK